VAIANPNSGLRQHWISWTILALANGLAEDQDHIT